MAWSQDVERAYQCWVQTKGACGSWCCVRGGLVMVVVCYGPCGIHVSFPAYPLFALSESHSEFGVPLCPLCYCFCLTSYQLGGCQSFIWQQIICCHQRKPQLVVMIITTQPTKADTCSLSESQPYCTHQLSLHQNISDLSDGSIQECLRVQTPFYLNHTLVVYF